MISPEMCGGWDCVRKYGQAVDEYCQTQGSGRGAAGLLLNVVCPYCGTPNDVGARIVLPVKHR